jgi:hypothetical protein
MTAILMERYNRSVMVAVLGTPFSIPPPVAVTVRKVQKVPFRRISVSYTNKAFMKGVSFLEILKLVYKETIILNHNCLQYCPIPFHEKGTDAKSAKKLRKVHYPHTVFLLSSL